MTYQVPVLETERLLLKPLEIADAAAIQRTFPKPEIVKYLAAHLPWPYPPDGAVRFLSDQALPAMAAGTQWHWSIRPKSSPDKLIGVISLLDDGETNRGFWIDPPWQGQGIATEAANAVTDYWFNTLDRPLLRIPKAAENIASRRISESSGMRLIGTEQQDYVSGTHLTEIWEITKQEWRDRNKPS